MQEGRVFAPARAVKTQPNAGIAENSATMKKSAERRCGNRLPQADNSRITRTIPTMKTKPEDVWFIDSGASNHMTSHKEWFLELQEPERPGYFETGDDTTHPIRHIGNVPFHERGKQTYIKNVLHVPTITKNLVSVGKWLSKACKFDSTKKGASWKKKTESSRAEEERAGCSFSICTR